MYTRILVSTDGAELATKGVDHGLALAKARPRQNKRPRRSEASRVCQKRWWAAKYAGVTWRGDRCRAMGCPRHIAGTSSGLDSSVRGICRAGEANPTIPTAKFCG